MKSKPYSSIPTHIPQKNPAGMHPACKVENPLTIQISKIREELELSLMQYKNFASIHINADLLIQEISAAGEVLSLPESHQESMFLAI